MLTEQTSASVQTFRLKSVIWIQTGRLSVTQYFCIENLGKFSATAWRGKGNKNWAGLLGLISWFWQEKLLRVKYKLSYGHKIFRNKRCLNLRAFPLVHLADAEPSWATPHPPFAFHLQLEHLSLAERTKPQMSFAQAGQARRHRFNLQLVQNGVHSKWMQKLYTKIKKGMSVTLMQL